MSDRAALLAAIVAHPDEDTPRLVYADWLDEHGEAKRAAAIRASVAHHRLSTADTATAVVWNVLGDGFEDGVQRIDWGAVDPDLGACRAAQRAVRVPRLTLRGEGVPRVPRVRFYSRAHGFYDTLVIDEATSFLKHADAIFRAAPITAVNFWGLTEAQAAEFVAAGHLARVRDLTLCEYNPDPDAVRVLGTHKDAAGVRGLTLEVSGSGNVGDVLGALAAGTHWSGLLDLDVSDLEPHDPGDEGPDDRQLAALFARPQFRSLRALRAWGSQVGDSAVRAIARNMPELRFLDLGSDPISERGWAALGASKTLSHLRHLDLGSSEDAEPDLAPLVAGANLPNLAVLLLDGANLSILSPKVLARSVRGPGLRVLGLSNVGLGAADAEALAACPAVRGVWHLDLSGIALDDEFLERFLAGAAFERLTYLNLNNNRLTARGATALAQWPGAASLQWLDVGDNDIATAGAKALAASPYLTKVKYLTATGRGIATLKKRFKKVFVA